MNFLNVKLHAVGLLLLLLVMRLCLLQSAVNVVSEFLDVPFMVDRGLFKLKKHHLVTALFILGDECSNNVLDLVFAVQNEFFVVPLVNNKPKLLGYGDS